MELNKVDYIEYNKEKNDEGYWGSMRRCALSQGGDVVKYHDKDDTNKWEDGSSVNWTEYENNGWNCMVEIPKVYYRVSKGEYMGFNEVRRWEISTEPKEGFKLHPSFNRPNHKTDVNYYGAFKGWVDSQNRLRSLPNKAPTANKNIDAFRAHAMNNGVVGHTQQDFYMRSLLQLLYITEYGTLDSQSVLGMGGSAQNTGASLKDGNNSTTASTSGYMSYRGIENFYSALYEFVDGVNVDNGKWNICGDYSKYSVASVKPNGYEYFATAPTSGGNIRDTHYIEGDNDFGFIPSAVGAGGFADNYQYSSGHRIVSSGFRSANANAGAFFWSTDSAPSGSYSNLGARLQFIGKL